MSESLYQSILSNGSIGGCHAWESDSNIRDYSVSAKELVQNAKLYKYLMTNVQFFSERGYLEKTFLYKNKGVDVFKYSPTEKAINDFEYKFREPK